MPLSYVNPHRRLSLFRLNYDEQDRKQINCTWKKKKAFKSDDQMQSVTHHEYGCSSDSFKCHYDFAVTY